MSAVFVILGAHPYAGLNGIRPWVSRRQFLRRGPELWARGPPPGGRRDPRLQPLAARPVRDAIVGEPGRGRDQNRGPGPWGLPARRSPARGPDLLSVPDGEPREAERRRRPAKAGGPGGPVSARDEGGRVRRAVPPEHRPQTGDRLPADPEGESRHRVLLVRRLRPHGTLRGPARARPEPGGARGDPERERGTLEGRARDPR